MGVSILFLITFVSEPILYRKGTKPMRVKADFHTHTTYCDGKSTPREMAEAAYRMGFTDFGISGHADYSFCTPDFGMSDRKLAAYKQELYALREEFAGRMNIYVGIELDCLGPIQEAEYAIGSVHCLEKNGELFSIDETEAILADAVNRLWGGKWYEFTKDYFELEATVYDRTKCSLSISGVTIDSWNYTDSGDLFLDLGYKVYVKGNTSDIAFNNTVSNGVLTMKAVPITYGKQVKTVTTTGTATITQPVDETTGMRTITVSALKSDVTLTFNGIDYNVVVGGNTTGLTWTKNTAGDGTVTIAATPTVQGTKVKEVSGSGSGTLTQTLNEITGVRTITIKNIGSTYTVTFAGCEDIDPWKDVTANGIYYVAADGSKADSPSSSCIGIVLVTGKHRFMIEKNEDKNAIYKTVAQQLGSSNTYTFSWGGYGTDQPDIPTYTGTGGGFSDSGNYLPHEDGSYSSSSYQMNGDYTTWTTGAVSDFNGKANSEVIKGITTNGSSSSTNTPMGILMNTFNSTANANYGYTDWYIPSCGQLALMFRKMQSINNALNAISGQPLASGYYWSSSEYSSGSGWIVGFNNGLVNGYNKGGLYRVRFVRDI